MSDTVISVERLSKVYRLGQVGTGTLTNDLKVWWAKARGKPNPLLRIGQTDHGNRDGETIWALKDVNFEVKQGEVLGIIGRNGAGKSTLLKILSQVTAPTQGCARVKGRVASLLEVGTGFHPELTGRENTYLNGAILGMTKAETGRKLDEIVAFAETEKFMDTPVKRYSSGMLVRLAFAVAAHLEPEVLLVDEVLAVGDAAFQKKCLGKMGDVAKGGRTVLFVSHNMVAVQSLCGDAVWLDRGSITRRGRCSQVVAEYLQSSAGSGSSEQIWDDPATAPGNEAVRLRRVGVCLERDLASGLITMASPFRIEVDWWNRVKDARLTVALHVIDEQGATAFTTGSSLDPQWRDRPLSVGLYRSTGYFPGNLFNSGRYRVLLLVVRNLSTIIYRHDDALSFDVVDLTERTEGWLGREPGVLQPLLRWTTEYVAEESPSADAVDALGVDREIPCPQPK